MVNNNINISLWNNDNLAYINIDINTNANTNFNETIVDKNYKDSCKNKPKINFKDLFQQI